MNRDVVEGGLAQQQSRAPKYDQDDFWEAAFQADCRSAVGLHYDNIKVASRFAVPPSVRAALFDLNGTVSISEGSYRHALRLAVEHLLNRFVPADVWSRVSSAWHMSDTAVCRSTLRALRLLMPEAVPASLGPRELTAVQKDFLDRASLEVPPAPVPGVEAIITGLSRAGAALALVTGSSADDGMRTLQRFGLLQHFALIISTHELSRNKPHPLPYAWALRRLGVPQEEALAFEDSVSGALSAHQAGVETVVRAGRGRGCRMAGDLRAGARSERLPFRRSAGITVVEEWPQVRMPG